MVRSAQALKTIAQISVFDSDCLPEVSFKDVMSGLNAQNYETHFFAAANWSVVSKHPQGDPRTIKMLERLEKLGLRPRKPVKDDRHGTFSLMLIRHYEPPDFDHVEFFEPHPVGHVGLIVKRAPTGCLKLKKSHLRLRNFLGKADWPWLVVSDDMRQKMERAGLKRLVFKETEADGRTLKDETNQIWEIDSSLELPPFSPKCDTRHNDGTPFTGKYSRGFNLVEGFYNIPEFHYTRAAIQSVGEFDLARTHECWGLTDAPRKLVCSRRFFDFCHAHKVKMEWIPVRIDPE